MRTTQSRSGARGTQWARWAGWPRLVPSGLLGLSLLWILGGCPQATDDTTDPNQTSQGAPGPAGPQGEQGEPGEQGPQGATGESGSLGIYGDGSAGAVTVDGSGVFPFDNPQFTSLSIASGESLHLVSGTIIRCTGDFTNNGTLNINVIACGGYTGDANVTADTLTYPYQPPHPGWSIRFPTAGEVAINAAGAAGGLGGTGLTVPEQARWLLHPGIFGGGGGANSSGGAGGYGGGALVILVRGTFTNNGTILARGDAGSGNSGAGAGGVIIIAARHAIDNSGGTIAARGADARDVTGAIGEALGGGGGGGGGIVHLLAPTIDAGTIDVAGGLGGAANPNPVAATKHVGGGGGGACGGNGGYGGGVPLGSPVVPESGTDGGIGQIILDEFDPTYVF